MEKQLLLDEMEKLNQMFGPRKNTKTLHIASVMWFQDLGHIPDETFLRCLKLVRQRCKFWPVPADVMQAYEEIISKPVYNDSKQIEHNANPDGPSPEVMRKSVEALRDRLAEKFGKI